MCFEEFEDERKNRSEGGCYIHVYIYPSISLPPSFYRYIDVTTILHLPTHGDNDVLRRFLTNGSRVLNLLDDLHPFDHSAKDDVFIVQKGRRHRRDEELTPVGIGTGILLHESPPYQS